MEPIMVMSPTSYKTTKACVRKAYLEQMSTKGNIHFDYGHAYGHAASELFKRANQPKEVRLGAAYASMFAYSKNFENLQDHYSNKILPKLVEGLRATDMIAQMIVREYEFIDEEVKVIIKVVDKKGIEYVVSGTYDLRLKNRITGKYVIMDFKAVAGDYLYSWETDPQIPIYTTLNQAVSNKLKLGYEYDAIGKYLVHYTNKKDDIFASRNIDPSFWKFNTVNVIKDFLKIGRAETIAARSHQQVQQLLETRAINPYLCNNNNYKCSHYQNCYQHKFEEGTGFDDRQPTNVIVIKLTEEEIIQAAQQISDTVVLQKVEDTDNLMSSEEMDMGFDSISELDLETEGTIDDILLNG